LPTGNVGVVEVDFFEAAEVVEVVEVVVGAGGRGSMSGVASMVSKPDLAATSAAMRPMVRGLHSSTFRLNLSMG
jgi:hypothetical protein